jgi:hypothetical protein
MEITISNFLLTKINYKYKDTIQNILNIINKNIKNSKAILTTKRKNLIFKTQYGGLLFDIAIVYKK